MKGTVIHLVSEARGGICRHVARLTEELEKAGWSSVLAGPVGSLKQIEQMRQQLMLPEDSPFIAQPSTPSPIPGRPGMQAPVRLPSIALPSSRLGPLAPLGTALSLRLFAGSLPQPRLLHAHGYKAAVLCVLSGWRPFVVTAHNMPPEGGAAVLPWALGRADTVIAVSTAIAEALLALGIDGHRVRVIPNPLALPPLPTPDQQANARAILGNPGVARTLFPSVSSEPDATRTPAASPLGPIILAVGRLSPEKGFDLLIEALPAIVQVYPEAMLAFFGDGPEKETLHAQAAACGAGRIYFFGEIPYPLNKMPGADVIVIPSRKEGQSLVALEALAAGVRVVASDAGGLPGMIRPGKTGWLFPAGDADALAQTVIEALQAPPDRYRQSGREMLAREFDPTRLCERILDVYSTLRDDRSKTDSQSNN